MAEWWLGRPPPTSVDTSPYGIQTVSSYLFFRDHLDVSNVDNLVMLDARDVHCILVNLRGNIALHLDAEILQDQQTRRYAIKQTEDSDWSPFLWRDGREERGQVLREKYFQFNIP